MGCRVVVICSARVLFRVGPTVIVVVGVGVVAKPVPIAICGLIGVLRESVVGVVHPIAIDIIIDEIAYSIPVRILWNAVIVVRVRTALVLDIVVVAVTVRIQCKDAERHIVHAAHVICIDLDVCVVATYVRTIRSD